LESSKWKLEYKCPQSEGLVTGALAEQLFFFYEMLRYLPGNATSLKMWRGRELP
jgi:hypothetical protein